MKKSIAMLLVIAMLGMLFSACSNTNSGDTSAIDSNEQSVSAETPADSESQAAAEPETESGDGTYTKVSDKVQSEVLDGEKSTRTDPEYAELYNLVETYRENTAAMLPGLERTYNADDQEISVKGVPYCYPLEGDNLEVSIFAVIAGNHQGVITDVGQYADFGYASDCTNVKLSFVSSSGMEQAEQTNLMVASGDMTDLIRNFDTNYTGTLASALEDEVIVDITDYVDEYCPNYQAWRTSNDEWIRTTTSDDGLILGWRSFNTETVPTRGWFIRKDKLEEWGIDAPVTIDEYVDCFARMKDEGSAATIATNSQEFYTLLSSAWNIASLDGAALYLDGDTVVTSWDSPNALEYVKTMADWYQKGYIYSDILSVGVMNDSTNNALTFNGDYFMFTDMASHYSDFFGNDVPEGWDVIGGHDPVLNAGDITHFDEPTDAGGLCVLTTCCDDIETACRFMDWWYTDEGINTCNYGPEGMSWYWTDEGERVFTDLVWHESEFGFVPSTAIGLYQMEARFEGVFDPWFTYLFTESTTPIETLSTWKADGDNSMYLPTSKISLTSEESDIIYATLTDLETYTNETISKMILGTLDIDSNWDTMIENIEGMGLRDIITQYQSAYDRYIAS